MKRILAFTLSAALLSVVAGCSPVDAGTVGIAANSEGDIVAVAEGCGERIASASLIEVGERSDRADDKELAEWRLTSGEKAPARHSWPITGTIQDPRMGTTSTVSRSLINDAVTYEVFVGTDSPSVNIGDVHFTGADLESLKPGMILMPNLKNWELDEDFPPLMSVTMRKFSKIACSNDYRES